MSNRERLPDRRNALVYGYRHNDQPYVVHVAFYGNNPAGRVAELFVTSQKTGSEIDTAVRATSTAISIALQYGADFDVLRAALPRGSDNQPLEGVGAAMDLLKKEIDIIAKEMAA